MIEHKPLAEIAGAQTDWLKAKHHFALGHYGNPGHRPVGNLYVWNDDEIAPHSGFPLHHHADVEIITYVREGVITHEDDLGNKGRTKAGDVQVMSAGTGIRHAERNDETMPTRIFQIWIAPRQRGGSPRWGTRPFPKADRSGRFIALASGRSSAEALPIRADAEIYGAVLFAGTVTEFEFEDGASAYLVPAAGTVAINGIRMEACEGLAVRDERSIRIEALTDAELVMVVTAPASGR
jgi:redox-sensitive bicupin YhaK (pirin superfamily)